MKLKFTYFIFSVLLTHAQVNIPLSINDVEKTFNLQFVLQKNNCTIIFPKKYGSTAQEKNNLLYMLLVDGHLKINKACASFQYQLMPFIRDRVIKENDDFFAKIILDSHIQKILGLELSEVFFYDFQLPIIAQYKYIDKILTEELSKKFAKEFCSKDYEEFIPPINGKNRGYYWNLIKVNGYSKNFINAVESTRDCIGVEIK